jgi:hypothetical protein
MNRGWRKPHREELTQFYASPNIIRVFTSKTMRWAGHTACMGEVRDKYKILVGRHEGKRPPEDLDIDVRITLELILGKQSGKVWTGCT